jgi:drug/metabolite transporter (DMT)-like permease
MNPLRIHLQLIGMAILWGASWPWGRMVAQAMPTFVASSLRFFFAIIPLIIWLYAANRFRYAKQLSANQWIGNFHFIFSLSQISKRCRRRRANSQCVAC